MPPVETHASATLARKVGYCLLPLLLGAGAALVLLLAAGGPAYASTLTYPGCGASIQACINGASTGDTLLISAGDYTESLTLSKAVSLTGALSSTTILHALPNTRVLTVTGAAVDSSVVISGLTFSDGNMTDTNGCPAGCGAGLLITGTAQPHLASLLLTHNFAGYWGGGLFATGDLDLEAVQFVSNTAQNGAGAYAAGNTRVTSGQFLSNTGYIPNCGGFGPCVGGLGAGLYAGGTLVLTGTLFDQNAGGQGGGVYAFGATTVENAVFQSNTGYRGAGLYAGAGLALTATQFLSNTADNDNGGGVFAAGPAQVSGGLFQNNHAIQGGGLFADSSVALDGVPFISNTAGVGGGFYANGAADVAGGLFQLNNASSGGGLVAPAGLTLTGTVFLSNTAGFAAALSANGPAILSATQVLNNSGSAAATIGAGSVVMNSSFSGNQGGALGVSGLATVIDSSFISNTSAYGAGIGASALVTVTGSSFLSNTGSGLYSTSDVSVSNSSFVNNVSGVFGQGLYTNGSVTVTNSSFINNEKGGLTGGTSLIIGSSFTGNGGIGFSGGSVNVVDSHFDNNLSSGAVIASGTVFSSTFSNNAGGLEIESDATVSHSSFISNSVLGIFAGGPITVSASSFISNTGSGLVANTSALVTDSLFMSNTASGGGGIAARDRVIVSGSRFIHNSATSGGGGGLVSTCTLCFGANAGSKVTNSLFEGNLSSSGGADVDVNSGNCCAFTGNMLLVHDTFASPETISGVAVYVANSLVGITDTIIASHTVGIQSANTDAFGDNNLFFANGTNISTVVGGGAHNLIGDPKFVNPAGGDYHLGTGSAAIDAGADAGVSTDFEGDPRPEGAGFDIGFDEFSAPSFVDVGVAKSASSPAPAPGQRITYTLVYSNAGPSIAVGVRLTDIVPINLVAVSYTSSGAALTPVGGAAYAWQVANLAPGSGGVITLTGVLTGGPRGSVFTNTAAITTAYSDTNPANNTSTVSLTVANAAPMAVGESYALPPHASLTVPAPGVLANDSDANHDPLTAALVTSPALGALSLAPTGAFTYTPPLNFTGQVTFTYRASDGLLLSPAATVTITVNAFKLDLPLLLR